MRLANALRSLSKRFDAVQSDTSSVAIDTIDYVAPTAQTLSPPSPAPSSSSPPFRRRSPGDRDQCEPITHDAPETGKHSKRNHLAAEQNRSDTPSLHARLRREIVP
jgi:hypothetical protein